MYRKTVTVAAMAALSSACDSMAPAPAVAVERDSAGVRIVENPSIDRLPVAYVSQDPLTRVGWAEDGPEFERVVSGALLHDGAVVVDLRGARTYFIRANGEVQEVGRRGEGPGEFQVPGSVVVGPDSVVLVWDLALGRLTTLSLEGRYLGSSSVALSGGAALAPIRAFSDSTLGWVPHSVALRADGGESRWLEGPLVVSDLTGVGADTIADVPFAKLESENGRPGSNPFGFFGGGGAYEDGFVWATNDESAATWLDTTGEVRLIARWEAQPTRVDDDTWRAFEDGIRARNDAAANPVEAAALEQRLRDQRSSASETLPLFRFVCVANDGTVWFSEYTFSGALATRYLRVTPDGRTRGWLQFPRPLRILDMSSDRALGIEENEWGVQSVVVYSIDP